MCQVTVRARSALIILVVLAMLLVSCPLLAVAQGEPHTIWQEAEGYREALIHLFRVKCLAIYPQLARMNAHPRYPGTMVVGSGAATFLIAPIAYNNRLITLETLIYEGGAFAVAWLTSEAVESEIPPGVFILCLQPSDHGFAVEYVNAEGSVVAQVPAYTGFGSEDPVLLLEHGREWLQNEYPDRTDLDVILVDVEIELGDPTEVFGSLLFWKTRLFEDP